MPPMFEHGVRARITQPATPILMASIREPERYAEPSTPGQQWLREARGAALVVVDSTAAVAVVDSMAEAAAAMAEVAKADR